MFPQLPLRAICTSISRALSWTIIQFSRVDRNLPLLVLCSLFTHKSFLQRYAETVSSLLFQEITFYPRFHPSHQDQQTKL